MDELDIFIKIAIILVKMGEENTKEFMKKDDSITIGFIYENHKYSITIQVEEENKNEC